MEEQSVYNNLIWFCSSDDFFLFDSQWQINGFVL